MARQNILGISLDENGIGYLPQGYFHVNRKSGTWEILLVDPKPTRKIMSKNPLTVILDINKFNGTNYTNLLRNLGPHLKSVRRSKDGMLTTAKSEASYWASMSNDMQKQYDRLDDVASILQRMKEVYAIPDRHTRYVATKTLFRAKMTKGSSVMLSLVEKLEDLKAGLDDDSYIDVIFQSLSLFYDPFIVNFNMNGLEKSINELINILVQYKATIKKSASSVLVGEASTSKMKGKRVGHWKKKKGKAKAKTVIVVMLRTLPLL
ncbi:hypothetical protein Sango_0665400 [Sesamum angolense]|uniref:Uncharacterized protein n=1 Tax=Sesamum angolense TaxID=2727404 RepID=A0AAE1X8A3_9LAMI|nr:hypothetical protein Sango_0665400 [Sesamum angolense]